MAVSTTVTVPTQPAVGSITLIPLGGDGFYAPQSMYQLEDVAAVADATAGQLQLTINMDPQFECIVQSLTYQISSAAGDKELVCSLSDRSLAYTDFAQVIALLPTITGLGSARATWCPAPMMDVGQITGVVVNVDTEALLISGQILNFNRNASRQVPLSVLLSSLPRAASIIT